MASLSYSLVCYFIILALPVAGLMSNLCVFRGNPCRGAFSATLGVWGAFTGVLICWVAGIPFLDKVEHLGLMVNELSWLMATLILFVSGVVHTFSIRYMAGDRQYRRYFISLTALTISALILVAADNVLILASSWLATNLILVFLMIHKFQWRAAKSSGILSLKTFLLGFVFLLLGCWMLISMTGTFSLHAMTQKQGDIAGDRGVIALFFIIGAAFTQSGIWPFHRWLISSLNSPTPVSALMHAGLVNGGGLLLARFAPLYLSQPLLLDCMFLFGIVTLTFGIVWKLIQSNVKRMLACSTMGQMGFMIMQCGLGLFSAAVAHLIWHGLFKAFLFLRAGSALQDKGRRLEEQACSIPLFMGSALCGIFAAYGFTAGSGMPFLSTDTFLVLTLFAWMAGTQFALTLLETKQTMGEFVVATFSCVAVGLAYGLSVHMIEQVLAPISIFMPQKLTVMHGIALLLIAFMWLSMNLKALLQWENSTWWRRFYVSMLNSSQPDPKTITTMRNEYEF